MTTKRTIPTQAYRFAAPVDLAGKDGALNKFAGVAYTGDILTHGFWEHVAFELSSIHPPQKLPMLIGHDRDKNAGFSESITVDDSGIQVSGKLLSNEDGKRIAADAAEGFPWQMSVHIVPDEIVQVKAGYEVNGRTFKADGVVFRNSTIREISFTPTGVDAGTSTEVFSFSYQDVQQGQSPEPQGGSSMTPEEAAALKAEKKELHDKFTAQTAELEELKTKFAAAQAEKEAIAKAAREAAITQLFSDLGTEAGDAQKEAMLGMTDTQFSAVADLMKAQKPKTPDHLFSEQHVEPNAGAGEGDEIMGGMLAALKEVQGE